ncbi:uncharacterized protein TRAVEDRAFT_25897 [Trametes versicolor FP-101664 SS1]|uniref:uncharacterized protein n=1 Tax=Trametes versicolor (strain FP-101664) TaxID=717944 RepID=UPI000462248B|nr:uncharacterized protein TRAVEDRAFT_25897 [Trametes versicolor FP-101664 SS1]EIW64869.1 hypothetical protein TRAVEDRAFT_25897 [Trametes versicolor FP-101664 SS1]
MFSLRLTPASAVMPRQRSQRPSLRPVAIENSSESLSQTYCWDSVPDDQAGASSCVQIRLQRVKPITRDGKEEGCRSP